MPAFEWHVRPSSPGPSFRRGPVPKARGHDFVRAAGQGGGQDLGEEGDLESRRPLERPRVLLAAAGENGEEGGLPRAVAPREADSVAGRDFELDVREQNFGADVGTNLPGSQEAHARLGPAIGGITRAAPVRRAARLRRRACRESSPPADPTPPTRTPRNDHGRRPSRRIRWLADGCGDDDEGERRASFCAAADCPATRASPRGAPGSSRAGPPRRERGLVFTSIVVRRHHRAGSMNSTVMPSPSAR